MLLSLALLIGVARLLGELARCLHQPAILGELLAGATNVVSHFKNGIQKMRLALLILLSACLPAAWGYCTFWLVAKWWPPRELSSDRAVRPDRAPAPHDYQI